MKKSIITATLLAAVTLAPCFTSVLTVVEAPGRASDLACAVASPIFWHLYDEFLTRELARITTAATPDSSRERGSQTNPLVCLLVDVLLTRAFDGSLTAAQKTDTMSIPQRLVRRVMERTFPVAPKFPAPLHHG